MDPLTVYKNSVKQQIDSADLLVANLVNENFILSEKLNTDSSEIKQLQKQIESLNAQVKDLETQVSQHTENSEIIKDLYEYLCNVRVHKTYEDDSGLWFDISQGTHTEGAAADDYSIMDYKLGFVKGQAQITEVIYAPVLKQRSTEELYSLQSKLPEYLFETLSFPLSSLNQFYNKIAKCLNKKRERKEETE
ncbi:Csm1p [Saccharomyces eubayanus]|uniref:Csm1p n=1 Tax=Saccharomyces eubayanus TaxID=1080349 RepID=UPI0006C37BC4|nr:CSM1-like protein [Saccharomyces eubayanus]KOH00732.1 CSM1-like protein [Saccharomyces eubayanus]